MKQGTGKTVTLGINPAVPIELDSFDLFRGKHVCGSLFGGLKPKLDIPILVDRYLKKVFIYLFAYSFVNSYKLYFISNLHVMISWD